MTQREFIDFLGAVGALKTVYRHNYTEAGRLESVADHSWRLALMPLLLEDDFCDLDINRVIRMCLIHDLGEAITGDIPCFKKTNSDEAAEEKALDDLLKALPTDAREKFNALLSEMSEQKTPESRLYKALDCLEAVISHNEADIGTWEPDEYKLQFAHGTDKVGWSEWLIGLKAEIDSDTRKKIASAL